MKSSRGKLGKFLKDVIDWDWAEFCQAEKDVKRTGYQGAVFALIRTCSEGKLGAIKLAIDRVDGKVETPIKVEYPKVWLLFPDAKSVALPPPNAPELKALPDPGSLPEVPPEEEPDDQETATASLRETLEKMAEQPRVLTQLILKRKREVEVDVAHTTDSEDADKKIPLVKSVVAANLLHLAIERNNFEAITELFDQIDGKLVETIRILGDDIFLTQYALEAPYGVAKNKDGIFMLKAEEITNQWKEKLKKT